MKVIRIPARIVSSRGVGVEIYAYCKYSGLPVAAPYLLNDTPSPHHILPEKHLYISQNTVPLS
jgi:hypothetical protein